MTKHTDILNFAKQRRGMRFDCTCPRAQIVRGTRRQRIAPRHEPLDSFNCVLVRLTGCRHTKDGRTPVVARCFPSPMRHVSVSRYGDYAGLLGANVLHGAGEVRGLPHRKPRP